MAFCHGRGDPANDGCCYVHGRPCSLRWKIVNDHILEGPNLTDLGTVDACIDGLVGGRQAQDRAKAQVQGVMYACRAAVAVVATDPSATSSRAAFLSSWASHPDYQSVADAWERIGLPRNYCQVYGPAEGQCCFAEDESTNTVKGASLSTVAVSVRRATTGAD